MLTKRLLFLSLSLSLCSTLSAQVGRVGINTTSPAAMLHVKDSSVVFSGVTTLPGTPSPPPISGAGKRMMWYPDKAAFRVGAVTSNYWNKDSIGIYSIAFGLDSKAKGSHSFALGSNAEASGNGSLAVGSNCEASGNNAVAMGSGNRSSKFSSTAIGNGNNSMGIHSIALGNSSDANGDYSFAAGSSCTASGQHTIAIGHSSDATGFSSIAIGTDNSSSGVRSVAIGGFNTASGGSSFAAGSNTLASNSASTAFGSQTIASGNGSTAMGLTTKAIGSGSLSLGTNTKAKSYLSVVLGRFNDTTSTSSTTWNLADPLFVIGNGSSENSLSNAVTVLKNGNTGIGTITPHTLLHVNRSNTTTIPSATAIAAFEDDTDVSVNLIAPSSDASAIFFGNPSNVQDGGIAYNAVVPDGLEFRTNGNAIRAVINNVGYMGVGESSPSARLHVSEGSGGGLYNANAEVIIEDDDQAYIQFSVPTSEESGILSGNSAASMRSGVLFRADSSLQLRSGGNTTRLVATKAGDIGINTLSPGAKLDVNGTTILGTNGTTLNEIIKATVLKNVTSVAANTSLIVDYSVTNAATTSAVYVSPEVDLTDGLIIAYARVNTAGVVRVKFTNTTGSAIDPPSMNYYITVIR